MRVLAYAAIIGVGLMASGVAAADTWSDPAGRFTVNIPHGWRVQTQTAAGANHTYIIARDSDHACHFIAMPNSGTAAASPAAVRRHAQDSLQYTQTTWVATANSVSPVFPGNSAQFVSNSLDGGSGFWPLERADLTSPHGVPSLAPGQPASPVSTVHAGITSRPGLDVMGFCYTISDPDYPTPDNPAVFDPILRSMGTASDATLQAAAEAAEASGAAAQQAAQEQQQQAQQQQQQQTQESQPRHDHREGPALSHP